MKKFVCSVCGYVYEAESLPADFKCPQCKAPASKFNEAAADKLNWACQHVIGIGKEGADDEIIEGLNQNFMGECTEVGMYLAMARVAHREGYPASTKKNLEMRVMAENGACEGKMKLAAKAKQMNLDAVHDTVHEMAKDEARHGCAFEGLLKRYFG